MNLDSSKASQDSNKSHQIEFWHFYRCFIFWIYQVLRNKCFSTSMKLANVTSVHKKGNRSEKDNYRPVSILPNLSKVFERCIYSQISRFFDKILSKQQCGFRKGHSAQHSLIVLLEKRKESVDQGHVFGALLTDFSKAKAFYSLPHNLFIAKLNAYGFDNKAVRFVYDYLLPINKELKYLIHIAHGKKSYREYPKVQ